MPTTLILMRHAKAVDRLEAEDDFQRGLTARGREDSAAAADALQDEGLKVDRALVSPSWRTRQTFEQLIPQIGSPKVDDPMALYHASTDMLERAVKSVMGECETLLLVGHNPGIGGFAHKLAQRCDATGHLPLGYPTATACVFELDSDDFDQPRFRFIFNPKGA
ncbi:SixA phosphatase family protein [Maricaulis parjimensis]|uniref:SixA phosphatase family protein n=1 Tax=Maricaulis parjimensis TaxID=144023 RepID=UPI0019398AA6|nr:histidine phosphatase family protein [Maricaulis parjimensis]